MHNETITFYSKTPPNRGVLDDFDISFWEENRTCGDDLKVYIKIENGIIKKWSFQGDTAIITTACASIFGESIIDMKIEEIFAFGYKYIEELIEMPISDRRKQASVLGLLTTRNALHTYLQDGKIDTFDDVLKI
ncbi:iron-sulfur cluster assembly scaffold protein [Candidatus Gracilibacteria bacterium]|nr:iron-sulfur cluster assembly scaffold protein [Candidatus Gracilibacteria bacterium]